MHYCLPAVRDLIDRQKAQYAALLMSHGDWQVRATRAVYAVAELHMERAELTEILLSLVAKDEEGCWTTVFEADTKLPTEFHDLLNELVNRA